MAKSVKGLEKQLHALQARVMAGEEENKKLRERAETAGTTAAGTAGRAERFNVQGVSGGNAGNLYFNSGRFGYSNRTPQKFRTIREKSSAGFGGCSFSWAVKDWSTH